MTALFEIEWCGGAAEKHFRKVRPFVDELPWGTIDPSQHAPGLIDRARIAWSSIALSEYRAAVGFAELMRAMLVARAPLDIVGMGSDFIADELLHVELASRLAMELGGGAPISVDFESLGVKTMPPNSALEHASELVVRVGCIAETLSGAIAVETRAVAPHPLINMIVERIARDEARHMRLGWLYMEWAAREMPDAERARLARVAIEELERISPMWRKRVRTPEMGENLGWLDRDRFRAHAMKTVTEEIVAPLARLGITIDANAVNALFD